MHALTRTVLSHRRAVVVIWLLLAVAGAATAKTTIGRLTTSYALAGSPGYAANQRIATLYGNGGAAAPTVAVIMLPAALRIDSRGVAAEAGRVFAAGHAVPHVRIADYATTGDRAFVTADARSTFALVFTPGNQPDTLQPADIAVARAVQAAAPAGWMVHVTGLRQLENTTPARPGNEVIAEAMLGALGALVVLAFVFASVLAVLPLAVAGVSILTTFLVLRAVTEVTEVSFIAEYLIALVGLGVGIDYSLLVVTRWREQRGRGQDPVAAVHAAMASAGRSVLLSGLVVSAALLALLALPVPFLHGLAYAGLLIPLVSAAAALTLLPILLATARRLDWPRRHVTPSPSPRWSGWARGVVRWRWAAAAVGLAALAGLILPLFSVHVGLPRATSLAASGPARAGLDRLLADDVPPGVLTPIEVLSTGDTDVLASRLSRLPGIYAAVAASSPDYKTDGAALITVLPVTEAGQPAGQRTVAAVRSATAHDAAVAGVGGVGVEIIDFTAATYGNLWKMLALIALVTFGLLAVAFRSLLLAAKAIALNFAAVAAATGVLVFVWQDGHGSDALWQVSPTGAITFWAPVFLFAFLFGLSMDYEVFILSRIREEYQATGSTPGAVVAGLGHTGRLVSSAALILALAFLAMSSTPATAIKILATGLGAGILIDATIIRCLLLPALVALFGRWNWWLPTRPTRSRKTAGPGAGAGKRQPENAPQISQSVPACTAGGRDDDGRTPGRHPDDGHHARSVPL
jgi:RND superfamily putative drug exporter